MVLVLLGVGGIEGGWRRFSVQPAGPPRTRDDFGFILRRVVSVRDTEPGSRAKHNELPLKHTHTTDGRVASLRFPATFNPSRLKVQSVRAKLPNSATTGLWSLSALHDGPETTLQESSCSPHEAGTNKPSQ